jgi:hypothetical protein
MANVKYKVKADHENRYPQYKDKEYEVVAWATREPTAMNRVIMRQVGKESEFWTSLNYFEPVE